MKKKNDENVLNQAQRFEEAAHELGCDESEAAFDEKLKKVAAHRPVELSIGFFADESPVPAHAKAVMRSNSLELEKITMKVPC